MLSSVDGRIDGEALRSVMGKGEYGRSVGAAQSKRFVREM
jgi:hypothetical protein